MGDASTTVLAGAKRPETGADSTEAQGEDDKERPSRSDLAAGAVTTLHPAAFREGVESGPPAPGNPRAQIDDIRALLGTPLATESTEVLNYTESDHPAPISRPSGEPDFAFEEGEGSPKPRHRRKGARKKKKKAGLAGGLLLWLTLGLGILVFCGLTLGLMFFRSLAQGPNSGQVEELLGLTDEAERPSGAAGTGETDTDPYSERWRALEGTDEPPVTDAAEDGDGAASDEESPSGDQARDSNASDPASTNEPERGGRKSAAVTGSSSKKTSRPKTSGKGRSSTTRKSPRGSNGKKSDSPEPPAAPETVLNINQAPRVVRAKIGRRTLFRVEIPSSPGGPDLSVQLRMRCVSDGGRWRLYKMTPSGRSTWSERINFDIGDRGRCEYYFTARADGDASSSSLGSKSEPLQVQVR